jgi:hypothetical protein
MENDNTSDNDELDEAGSTRHRIPPNMLLLPEENEKYIREQKSIFSTSCAKGQVSIELSWSSGTSTNTEEDHGISYGISLS